MKKKWLLCMALLCLCPMLLGSCSGGLTGATKRPAEVQTSLLVADDAFENDLSISAGDMAKDAQLVEEVCRVIRSEAVLSVLEENLDFVTADEISRMLTVKEAKDTAVIRVTFSSQEYTREQLLEIAHTFCAVVPMKIHQFMSGVRLSVVDMPR